MNFDSKILESQNNSLFRFDLAMMVSAEVTGLLDHTWWDSGCPGGTLGVRGPATRAVSIAMKDL